MEKIMEDKILDFNGFTEGYLSLTSPFPFKAKVEMKQFTIMTGMNNTGKSFYNKIMWATTFFFNLKIIEKSLNFKEEKSDIEMFQYILDNTFMEQNFNGEFQFSARDELLNVAFSTVRYTLENGKLTDLYFDFPKETKPMGSVIYLSKEARDFGNIENYLKIKKMLGVDEIDSWNNLEKLGEFNKLYDIIAIENLLEKLKNINPMLEMIKSLDDDELLGETDLVGIEYNKDTSEIFYITSKEEKKRLGALGAGTQSIILMLLSAVTA